MGTAGQILKEERERKFYTLDEIEKATKIRRELLEALEKDQYSKLPPPTFVRGFIKNYGRFLGLETNKLLAIYRREFSEGKNPPRILESFSNPLDRKKFALTPAKFVGLTVLSMIAVFFVYLWFEYRFLTGAPFLEVTQPVNQIGVETSTILVSGRTDPEAKVSINNQEIQAGIDGKFAQEINLTEGSNTIVVSATSPSGKVSKIERNVFLKKL